MKQFCKKGNDKRQNEREKEINRRRQREREQLTKAERKRTIDEKKEKNGKE